MTDSDTESEKWNSCAGECFLCLSREEWIEDNISWILEDFIAMSGVTIEYNNPQS